MNAPKVSVIIPLYNAEKFIAECLESLLAQTFDDFEVIVVDDCSTDFGPTIVERYIQKFGGRLKISRTEKNSGGGGLPRNKGLKISRGEYVFFMDADDLLTPTALEELYTLAEIFSADVVYCEKYFAARADLGEIYIDSEQEGGFVDKPTFETDDLARRVEDILNYRFWVPPWLKFVRRDFMIEHEIFFPHTKTAQDDIWTYGLIFHAKRFLRVPNVVYIYRLSENSKQRTKRTPEDVIKFWLHPIIFGIKNLDALMSNIEFFKNNLNYRYAVLENFVHCKVASVFNSSLRVEPSATYAAIKNEFGKDFGEHEILFSCLLTDLLEQQKIFVADRQRIAELEARQ